MAEFIKCTKSCAAWAN